MLRRPFSFAAGSSPNEALKRRLCITCGGVGSGSPEHTAALPEQLLSLAPLRFSFQRNGVDRTEWIRRQPSDGSASRRLQGFLITGPSLEDPRIVLETASLDRLGQSKLCPRCHTGLSDSHVLMSVPARPPALHHPPGTTTFPGVTTLVSRYLIACPRPSFRSSA